MLSGTNQIFIGASNKTTNISGSIVNIADAGLSAAGRVNIATGTNTTGSEVTIGTTTLTNLFLRGNEVKINEAGGGTVFIGNPTTGTTDINSNITNIGTTGLSATGRVNIGTGANATGSAIYVGSTTLSANYIRGNYVNINHQTLKNTNIGSDSGGVTALLGNIEFGSNGAGTINLWRPLVPNYGYGTYGTTGSGKIGEIFDGTYNPAYSGAIPNDTGYTYATITLTQTGVYIIQGFILIYGNANGTTYMSRVQGWIGEPNAVYGLVQVVNQSPGIGPVCINVCSIVYNVGTITYGLVTATAYSGSAPYANSYNFRYRAVRIA